MYTSQGNVVIIRRKLYTLMYTNYEEDSNELIYDLRQTYAQILTDILVNIHRARTEKKFSEWFEALENLKIEINQKLTKKERERYKKRLYTCLEILNKYPEAYSGKDTDPTRRREVIKALRELDEWLRDKMEKHKMFGAKFEDDGL